MDHFSTEVLFYILDSSFFESFFKIFFLDLLDFLLWGTSCMKLRDNLYGFRPMHRPETLVPQCLPSSPCYFFSSDELTPDKGRKGFFFSSLPSFSLWILKRHIVWPQHMSSHDFQSCVQLRETKTTFSFHNKCSES